MSVSRAMPRCISPDEVIIGRRYFTTRMIPLSGYMIFGPFEVLAMPDSVPIARSKKLIGVWKYVLARWHNGLRVVEGNVPVPYQSWAMFLGYFDGLYEYSPEALAYFECENERRRQTSY